MINFYTHLELYNKITINRNQRKIFQIFKMQCIFLSYIKKLKKTIATSNRKKNKEISKDACNKNLKKQEIKRFQPYKRSLYEEIILVVI